MCRIMRKVINRDLTARNGGVQFCFLLPGILSSIYDSDFTLLQKRDVELQNLLKQ